MVPPPLIFQTALLSRAELSSGFTGEFSWRELAVLTDRLTRRGGTNCNLLIRGGPTWCSVAGGGGAAARRRRRRRTSYCS